MPEMPDARQRFSASAKANPGRFALATNDDDSATLHIYGAIGGWWSGVAADELVPEIRNLDVTTLNVYINSPGGDVYEGIAIRNALRQHKAKVVTHVDGLAASAASFIACAGDEVVMGENAEIMIHDAWGIGIGNAEEMRTLADDLDRISGNIAAMYAAKAGGDTDEWRDRMKAETWYSASEAVAVGLADRLDSDTEDEADTEAQNLFDLSMYANAHGRPAARESIPVAAMATTRKEASTMTEITIDELDKRLAAQRDELTREFDVRVANIASARPNAGPRWNSFGAYLKDLVGGSADAMAFYERNAAYDGATTADDNLPNTWVKDAIKLIARNRRILNTFHTEALPAEGMTLEYLQLESNSIAVAKQATQGADLVKGKVSLKSDSTPVETYGGWTELSRQIIDRASAAYLNTAYTAMNIEYARATEQVVRDLLKGIITAASPELTIATGANAYAWLDLIVDASQLFDDNGYTLDGALVSIDVFKKLIRLEDTNGNSLMRVWGQGTNQVGEIDLRNIKGDLASVQFEILPDAAAGTLEFHNELAITTWESPGAPFRLQDNNVVNLTEAVSQYGYLAAASQFPDAIQVVEITA